MLPRLTGSPSWVNVCGKGGECGECEKCGECGECGECEKCGECGECGKCGKINMEHSFFYFVLHLNMSVYANEEDEI